MPVGGKSTGTKKQALFVIFIGLQVAPGSCYIAQDAFPTMMKSKAGFRHSEDFVNHPTLKSATSRVGESTLPIRDQVTL